MKSNVEMEVINLGSIKEAEIKLDKINVITGVNGSGKTILSKLLYFYIITNSTEGDCLINKRVYEVFNNFIWYWSRNMEYKNTSHDYAIFESLFDDWNNKESSYDYFIQYFLKLKGFIQNSKLVCNDKCLEMLTKIKNLIETLNEPTIKYYGRVNFLLNTEFGLSWLKMYSDAQIKFHGDYEDKSFVISSNFKDDHLTSNFEGYSDCINFSEIIYINSQSIFDFYGDNILINQNNLYHESYNENIIKLENNIKNILGGEFIYDNQNNKFLFVSSDGTQTGIKNISSGFKQMGVIQLLLSNRVLTPNSFIIIDKPETNLHPDFQIKLAEILVRLSNELNVHLYINSHSPQFIEALELYTAKYDLIKETSFYIAEKTTNSTYVYKSIERNMLSLLYNNLGTAYEVLDKLRAENINNSKF